MLKLSCRLAVALCAIFTLLVPGLCLAQDHESIYVANVRVITIRDKGTFNSTRERAIAIEKAIVEIISKQDTQNPKLSIKDVNGLWTVFCGDVKVVEVQPAEAKANNLPAKSIAASWMKNLQVNLPKATPCSKLPASAFQPKPGTVPVAPKPAVKPAPKPAPKPVVVEVPVTVAPVPTGPLPAPVKPVAAIGAPLLLVRDSFETIRALPEEEFAAKRDELANHLIADLSPFITGKVAASVAGPAIPVIETPITPKPAKPVVTPVKPVVTPVKPPAPKPVVTPVKPPKPGVKPPKPVAGSMVKPAVVDPAVANAANPAYEKVPQKNRIREKLEKVREPYLALIAEDPQTAKPIGGLLASCRNAFAKGDYDQSEQQVDSAMALLGLK